VSVVAGEGEVGGGWFVHDHGGVGMKLDGRRWDHRGEGSFDSTGDRACLVGTGRDEDQVSGFEDGGETLGDDVSVKCRRMKW
jgi:hypothetical protein